MSDIITIRQRTDDTDMLDLIGRCPPRKGDTKPRWIAWGMVHVDFVGSDLLSTIREEGEIDVYLERCT